MEQATVTQGMLHPHSYNVGNGSTTLVDLDLDEVDLSWVIVGACLGAALLVALTLACRVYLSDRSSPVRRSTRYCLFTHSGHR
jgi:hypothetical protein